MNLELSDANVSLRKFVLKNDLFSLYQLTIFFISSIEQLQFKDLHIYWKYFSIYQTLFILFSIWKLAHYYALIIILPYLLIILYSLL